MLLRRPVVGAGTEFEPHDGPDVARRQSHARGDAGRVGEVHRLSVRFVDAQAPGGIA